MLKAQRALISVYDKRELGEFARGLVHLGIEILSTGGTADFLTREGLPIVRVSEVTGMPEMLSGRVKTLHPRIHGGILADRARATHLAELRDQGITPIDLVVVNLYPFRRTAQNAGASFEEVVDMIDVGGPTMVRAAAKNHSGVVTVVDPGDYPQVLATLESSDGVVPAGLRRRLAIKAFRHTEAYDAAISEWLEQQGDDSEQRFPPHRLIDLTKLTEPRYGENPHQEAALYEILGGPGVLGGFEQLQGVELSYNNLLDADAARRLVAEFDEPAAVIIKHTNPCGVGRGESLAQAYERALETDPVSAFGSVVAFNRTVGSEPAEVMRSQFVELVVAPEYTDGARTIFGTKKNRRVIECPPFAPGQRGLEFRALDGGFLLQTPDTVADEIAEWRCPTERQVSGEERRALEFAWRLARHVKSNAIVIANESQTVGIGAGQMSRVDSCRIAIDKARLPIRGCVAASDAFFPFRDGLDLLAEAGVEAVIQPGGSKRDEEVIAAADEHGIAMLLTGRRHFRH